MGDERGEDLRGGPEGRKAQRKVSTMQKREPYGIAMCVCMRICMCACMCVHAFVYVYVCMCICVCACIRACVCVPVIVSVHVCGRSLGCSDIWREH